MIEPSVRCHTECQRSGKMEKVLQIVADAIGASLYSEYAEHPEWDEAKDMVENANPVAMAGTVLKLLGQFGAVDDIASAWQTAAMCEADRAKKAEEDCRHWAKDYEELTNRLLSHKAEISKLREALQKIACHEVERVRAWKFRTDGVISKEDHCPHSKPMWDDCAECVAEFASCALRGAPKPRIERDGKWYVPLKPAVAEPDTHTFPLEQLRGDEIMVSPGWIYIPEQTP